MKEQMPKEFPQWYKDKFIPHLRTLKELQRRLDGKCLNTITGCPFHVAIDIHTEYWKIGLKCTCDELFYWLDLRTQCPCTILGIKAVILLDQIIEKLEPEWWV